MAARRVARCQRPWRRRSSRRGGGLASEVEPAVPRGCLELEGAGEFERESPPTSAASVITSSCVGVRALARGHVPVRGEDVDPGLPRREVDLLVVEVRKDERVGVRGARPRSVLATPVAEDARLADSGEAHVEARRAARVVDHVGDPDVGVDDHDVPRGDRLSVHAIDLGDVIQRGARALQARVGARPGVVVIENARVEPVGDEHVVGLDAADEAPNGVRVIR